MAKVAINWSEILVTDLDRAAQLYTTVMDVKMMRMETPNGEIRAFFNGDTPVGALSPAQQPVLDRHPDLDAGGQIEATLERVEQSGGEVVLPKTAIGVDGHIAQLTDCEGNWIALHSM